MRIFRSFTAIVEHKMESEHDYAFSKKVSKHITPWLIWHEIRSDKGGGF